MPLSEDSVRAILTEPQSDALRLGYAQKLRERNDPRGELIEGNVSLSPVLT